MTWWSVLIEAFAPEGAESIEVTDERYDALADAVVDEDGVVSGGPTSYSVRLSVEADEAVPAVMLGRDLVWKAAANAGLPEWPFVRVEAVTHDELEKELSEPNFPALLGAHEVAEALGVSRQRLSQIRQAKPDFPRPVVELAAGPVWIRDAVAAWAKTWERRPGRPTSEANASSRRA